MIKAVFYDLDGVLVDACEWHYLSLNKALEKISGIQISRNDHENIFNGWPTKKKLDMLLVQGKIKDCDLLTIWELKQKFTIETIKENSMIDVCKIQLHSEIKSRGILTACVTNSINETAKLMLEQTGQMEFIDFLISNDMVRYPKPHGEGYIRAMIHFGIMPENVLIVEDSAVGILSANSTGANVLKVNNSHDVNLNNIIKHLG